MNYYITDNLAGSVSLKDIPEVEYAALYNDLKERLKQDSYHVAHYFATPDGNRLRFYILLLDDAAHKVMVSSFSMEYYEDVALPSLTALHPALHVYEREISELYNVEFDSMPWNKPLRFPFNRRNRNSTMDNYPFYTIEGESLHEVNVGPIHAGIIEPGAFRFVCNGENVLHLEIALGYQHRGVEQAFCSTENRLRQTLLAEGIAGDSAVSHATAYATTIEKLCGKRASTALDVERTVALELERMAMHIADTGALSMDVGYQLGQVACEALRTMTINTTQAWCGNRFGKGLIRPCGTNKPLTAEKVEMIRTNVKEIRRRYNEVREDIKSSPTLLSRFEECGIVPKAEMQRIGGVGMAARASGVKRDIRASHPYAAYSTEIAHESIVKRQGDIMSRLMIRSREVLQSADYIEQLLASYTPTELSRPDYEAELAAEALSFSMVEGWRGEICHVAITDNKGVISTYKVKDPSLHNWLALAIAVRGEGISDFPICNKSFNLSYCGHDL
ncbi:MAG: NADH-quinone oxidoreductase subunit C [Alistipes sp.]|nr:NADH-quinone oxidoreductase subunit C [Alistipes sp.]MBP3601707.1 NADH-quinone oxidoreductase subunit C [Alistipes sp.]